MPDLFSSGYCHQHISGSLNFITNIFRIFFCQAILIYDNNNNNNDNNSNDNNNNDDDNDDNNRVCHFHVTIVRFEFCCIFSLLMSCDVSYFYIGVGRGRS